MLDLIEKIIEQLTTGANYAEYQASKYLIAKTILNSFIYPTEIVAPTDRATAEDLVIAVKKASNDFTFMKSKYNIAKVKTKTDKADQVILIDSAADALIDVKVLAVAFNMSIDEFEEYAKTHNILFMTKDFYENRLRADLVVILEDLKQDFIAEAYGIEMDCTDYVVNVADIDKIIQQKITSLKEAT